MPVPAVPSKVVAVVVTLNRPELLRQSLDVLASQTRPVDRVVVVDNGHQTETAAVVASCGLPAVYLPSLQNLGGAGGFALGILTALSLGADWVWLADDDGRPGGDAVLSTLLRCAEKNALDEVSPIVVDIRNPENLAFPLRRGLKWRRTRAELGPGDLLPGIASLFNGALFRASCLDMVGLPDHRLFIRGDEVDMHRRLVRSGLRFGTCLETTYLHPDGADEFVPILGGRMHSQYPADDVKRYYTYRNRGYLMAQRGMRHLLIQEWFRFAWLFLVERHDLAGLREWRRLRRLGRDERMYRF